MQDSNSSNNQDILSAEFIDKTSDSHSFASQNVQIKNNDSDDNEQHNIIEDFSQSNNQDSRNDSEKKVDDVHHKDQENSSSEPQYIYKEHHSDDSQNQNNNDQNNNNNNHNNDNINNNNQSEQKNEDELYRQNQERTSNDNDDDNSGENNNNEEYNNKQVYTEPSEEIVTGLHSNHEDNHSLIHSEKEFKEEQEQDQEQTQLEAELDNHNSNQPTPNNQNNNSNQHSEIYDHSQNTVEQQAHLQEQQEEEQQQNQEDVIDQGEYKSELFNLQQYNEQEYQEGQDQQNQQQQYKQEDKLDQEEQEENQTLLQDKQDEEQKEDQALLQDKQQVEEENQILLQNEEEQEQNNSSQEINIDQNNQNNYSNIEGSQQINQHQEQQHVAQQNQPKQEKDSQNQINLNNTEDQQPQLQQNNQNNQESKNNKQQLKQDDDEIQDPSQIDPQQQYYYMMEVQKKQAEFQKQMEELNQKFKINFRKIVDIKQESLEGNYIAGLLAIKMKYKAIDTRDQQGLTMLHNAVLGNEKELVVFLLNNGADVNSIDYAQRTPLMMAAHGGASRNLQSPDSNNHNNNSKKNFDEDSEEFRRTMKMHSFNKIFKILIDNGACFASKDIYQFSALLYSVQNQNLLILFYLIYLGANLRDSDQNGSSVVHWNAYKGNRFLMEVFNTLNLDMFTADNQGYTPLQRSILGISYNTIDYLARLIPPEKLPDPLQKDQDNQYIILSPSIRNNLLQIKYHNTKYVNRILNFWKEKCEKSIEENGLHPATFVFFFISGMLFYSAFVQIYINKSYSHKQNESFLSSFQFLINITFFIATFIYMSFSVRMANTMVSYKNKNKGEYILDNEAINREAQLNLENERNIPNYMKTIMSDRNQFERMIQRLNFKNLNRLLEDAPEYIKTINKEDELNRQIQKDNNNSSKDDEESRMNLTNNSNNIINNTHTFIHQIAILFENNYFTSLGDIDFQRLCGCCLKYKPEKTKHCKICKICVPYYQFHSTLFGMCISAENHFLYLLHLMFLQVSLFTYVLISHIQYGQYLTSWAIFKYAEIPYHMSYKIGIIHSLIYCIVLFALFYNSVYCIIEIMGIFENKTRDEILNPFEYSYNFEVITDKHGNLIKVQKVRTTGLIEYLKETLKIVYYRTFVFLKQKR